MDERIRHGRRQGRELRRVESSTRQRSRKRSHLPGGGKTLLHPIFPLLVALSRIVPRTEVTSREGYSIGRIGSSATTPQSSTEPCLSATDAASRKPRRAKDRQRSRSSSLIFPGGDWNVFVTITASTRSLVRSLKRGERTLTSGQCR